MTGPLANASQDGIESSYTTDTKQVQANRCTGPSTELLADDALSPGKSG